MPSKWYACCTSSGRNASPARSILLSLALRGVRGVVLERARRRADGPSDRIELPPPLRRARIHRSPRGTRLRDGDRLVHTIQLSRDGARLSSGGDRPLPPRRTLASAFRCGRQRALLEFRVYPAT